MARERMHDWLRNEKFLIAAQTCVTQKEWDDQEKMRRGRWGLRQ